MSIEAITPVASESLRAATQAGKPGGADFGKWMMQQVDDVSRQINTSEAGLIQLASGETGNLHHVMLELEISKVAFELTLQIRNKLLEGYQDIMRMQI